MYIRCTYGIFSREITIQTVIYGVCIRFWPTLHMYYAQEMVRELALLITIGHCLHALCVVQCVTGTNRALLANIVRGAVSVRDR